MKFTEFDITNFKGVPKLTIDFNKVPHPNIYTLVGLNESGKTSILEAIDFFGNGWNKEYSLIIPKNKLANFNDMISVCAKVVCDEKDILRIKEYAYNQVGFEITEISPKIKIDKKLEFKDSHFKELHEIWDLVIIGKDKGSRKKPTSLNNDSAKWDKIVNNIKQSMPKIIYYPNFLFDLPEKIFLVEQQKDEEQQKIYRSIIQDVLDSLNGEYDLKTHIVNRMKGSDSTNKLALESLIEKMSIKMTETIFSAWKEIFGKSTAKEITLRLDTYNGQPYIEIKIKQGSEIYRLKECSLGVRWFFTFLLFTEFRQKRENDPGETLFLLDEPASNLHSTAQKILLSTFNTWNSKLVYTTHSHHLINPLWLSGTYIVENKAINYDDSDLDSPKTDITAILYRIFASQYPKRTTYFQPILDALDYQPSFLENVPNLVILEGRNDYYTFRYLQEIIFKNKFDSINFYPGQGASNHTPIIALQIAWGKKVIVLLDGDLEGRNAKSRYIEKFGSIVEDGIFTLSDIDMFADNTKTEGLFTTSDRMAIIKEIFPLETSYSKEKFNVAIEQLYIQKKEMEISSNTLNNFEKIFNKVKSKL